MPTRLDYLKDPNFKLRRYLPLIKQAEGTRMNKAKNRHVIYKDHKGYYTLGYGHLLGKTLEEAKKSPYWGKQLTNEEAETLALKDMSTKMDRINKDFGVNASYWGDDLQGQTLLSYFRGGLPGSPKTKALMQEGDFAKAAGEFLNSKEYLKSLEEGTGVAPRMQGLANALEAEAKRQEQIRKSKSPNTKKIIKPHIAEDASFESAVAQRLI